ncbi:MAG TPA: hypothetical protein VFB62_02495 [Polyangiaceae bacterium]|nr:hypothetical protein [Polyangiaceae bacterium]
MRWMPLGCALFLVIPGCRANEPTEEDYDDVATAVGALVSNESGGEVGSMDDAAAVATGETPSGLTSEGSGSYQGARLGLSYSYQVTCKDVSGNTLESCDGATESANLVVDWGGSLDLARYDATIARTGDWTLSGLQSEVAQFDGHGTFDVETHFTSLFRDVERSFLLDYDAQYDAVRWNRITKIPQAGSITYDVHAVRTKTRGSRESERELDVQVIVAFDESGTADISIDRERHYSLELLSGQISKQ